jgi:acyl dehydratase
VTLIIKNPSDFHNYVGKPLGTSDWLTVDQKMIDEFANATGDRQWIHVDVERAKTEMPEGKTIAHGYLTLALMPRLGPIFRVEQRSRALNYGIDTLRFTGAVPSGSEIRLTQSVKKVESIKGGQRVFLESVVEVKGKERPAMVAELILQFYD